MERLTHSLSKKHYNYTPNGHLPSTKPLYDDVCGAPSHFSFPTLSPRSEDYAEIFGSVTYSRPSSAIPFLDIPSIDGSDLCFDVRTSRFDYCQVFGGFNGWDSAVSCEDLFPQSNGGDDSSEDAWTPAQSESLSDESDPSACSGTNQGFANGDSDQSCDGTKQFNISYHKANRQGEEDMLSGMTNVTQLQAVSGFAILLGETPPLRNAEDKNPPLQITPDVNLGSEFGGLIEGKRLRKTMSNPPNIVPSSQSHGSDNHLAGHGKNRPCRDDTFITVCDISLKTRPSMLPPPSRPPPALAVKKGHSDGLNSRFRASKSYNFERMAPDNSPPFFDVEVDASTSAVASAAAMRDTVAKAEAKLRCAKESKERKEEVVQKLTKLHSENDIKTKVRKTTETFDGFDSFKDEKVLGTHESNVGGMKLFTGEESQTVLKTTKVVSGSKEEEKLVGGAENPAELIQEKHYSSSQRSYKTEGFVARREAAPFYEVVETDQFSSDQFKDEKILVRNMKSQEYREMENTAIEAFQQQEHNRKTKAASEACEWEKNRNRILGAKEACESDENKGRSDVAKHSNSQDDEHQEKIKVAERGYEQKENDQNLRVAEEHEEIRRKRSEEDKCEELDDQQTQNELGAEQKLQRAHQKIEIEKRLENTHGMNGSGIRSEETFEREEDETRLNVTIKQAENEERMEETLQQKEKEEQQKEAREREEIEKKQKDSCERDENEKRLNEALEQQNERRLRKGCKQEENENILNKPLEWDETATMHKEAREREENEKIQNEAREREESKKRLAEAWEQQSQEAYEREASERRLEVTFNEEGNDRRLNGDIECENRIRVAGVSEGLKGQSKDCQQTEWDKVKRKLSSNQQVPVKMELQNVKAFDGVCELEEDNENPQVIEVTSEHDTNSVKLEATQKVISREEDENLRTELEDTEREPEAIEEVYVEKSFNVSGMHQDSLQYKGNHLRMENDSVTKSNGVGIGIGQTLVESDKRASRMATGPENANFLTHQPGDTGNDTKGVQFTFDLDRIKDKFTMFRVVREWVENGSKTRDALSAMLEGEGNTQSIARKAASQSTERKERNFNETLTAEREKEERLKRDQELENNCLRKIEEEREREREREKDRMAVDRVTREARERAFAEARERAERTAVARATSEVRQRAMTEARERLEKASAEARERSLAQKAYMEARLRAERAAVERATVEARERAVERAMSEKAAFEARERLERPVVDKFSASSRSGGVRQSSSSSDLQDLPFQNMESSNGLRYLYSSVPGGVEGETAQRCKARLERHQRTAERAAKALAEKNMRDILAQREQAERSRLSETLDAEVKRWSSLKEGNLRALLSTLQYILGPDSGWQSIPLTEVITSAAVKKAYRKATLCVHPDKLQQRGASIQQKYICEKVFDLLKEAWNKFNSEEW